MYTITVQQARRQRRMAVILSSCHVCTLMFIELVRLLGCGLVCQSGCCICQCKEIWLVGNVSSWVVEQVSSWVVEQD